MHKIFLKRLLISVCIWQVLNVETSAKTPQIPSGCECPLNVRAPVYSSKKGTASCISGAAAVAPHHCSCPSGWVVSTVKAEVSCKRDSGKKNTARK